MSWNVVPPVVIDAGFFDNIEDGIRESKEMWKSVSNSLSELSECISMSVDPLVCELQRTLESIRGVAEVVSDYLEHYGQSIGVLKKTLGESFQICHVPDHTCGNNQMCDGIGVSEGQTGRIVDRGSKSGGSDNGLTNGILGSILVEMAMDIAGYNDLFKIICYSVVLISVLILHR